MRALIDGFFDNVVSPTLFGLWLKVEKNQPPPGMSLVPRTIELRRYCRNYTHQEWARAITIFSFVVGCLGVMSGGVASQKEVCAFSFGIASLAWILGAGAFLMWLTGHREETIQHQAEQVFKDCRELQLRWTRGTPPIGLLSEAELRHQAEECLIYLALKITEYENSPEVISEEDRNRIVLERRKGFQEHFRLFLKFDLAEKKWDRYFAIARARLAEPPAEPNQESASSVNDPPITLADLMAVEGVRR